MVSAMKAVAAFGIFALIAILILVPYSEAAKAGKGTSGKVSANSEETEQIQCNSEYDTKAACENTCGGAGTCTSKDKDVLISKIEYGCRHVTIVPAKEPGGTGKNGVCGECPSGYDRECDCEDKKIAGIKYGETCPSSTCTKTKKECMQPPLDASGNVITNPCPQILGLAEGKGKLVKTKDCSSNEKKKVFCCNTPIQAVLTTPPIQETGTVPGAGTPPGSGTTEIGKNTNTGTAITTGTPTGTTNTGTDTITTTPTATAYVTSSPSSTPIPTVTTTPTPTITATPIPPSCSIKGGKTSEEIYSGESVQIDVKYGNFAAVPASASCGAISAQAPTCDANKKECKVTCGPYASGTTFAVSLETVDCGNMQITIKDNCKKSQAKTGDGCVYAGITDGVCCDNNCIDRTHLCTKTNSYYGAGTYRMYDKENAQMTNYTFQVWDIGDTTVMIRAIKKNRADETALLEAGKTLERDGAKVTPITISKNKIATMSYADIKLEETIQAQTNPSGTPSPSTTPGSSNGNAGTSGNTNMLGNATALANQTQSNQITATADDICKGMGTSQDKICYKDNNYNSSCQAQMVTGDSATEVEKNSTSGTCGQQEVYDVLNNLTINGNGTEVAPACKITDQECAYGAGGNGGCCPEYECDLNIGTYLASQKGFCKFKKPKNSIMIAETELEPYPVNPYKETHTFSVTNSKSGLDNATITGPDGSYGGKCTVNPNDNKTFTCEIPPLAQGKYIINTYGNGEAGEAELVIDEKGYAKVNNLDRTSKLSDDTPILFLGFAIIIVAISILIYTKYGREIPLERKDRKELELMKDNCENELKLIKYRYMKREIDDMTYKNLSQQVEERKSQLMSYLAKFEKKGEKKN